MNGCAFCIDRPSREAGQALRKLQALPIWRGVPLFTPRERAALAWTEALTEHPANRVTEALQTKVNTQFPDKELEAQS
jgi:alkylhydroperoxidase family enzyme